MEGIIGGGEAVVDRTGKLAVEHEEFDNLVRYDRAVSFTIHFQGARRSQHGRPLNVVQWRSDIRNRGQQDEIFHIQQSRSLVRSFQKTTHAVKMPSLVVQHCRFRDAIEEMTRLFYFAKKAI